MFFLFVILGIVGDIGSGKSWTQMRVVLDYAEKRQKQIVFNFPIDREGLYKYACSPKPRLFRINEIAYFFRLFYSVLVFYVFVMFHLFFPDRFIYPVFRMPAPLPPRLPWIKRLCERGGIIEIHSPKLLRALMIPESVVALDEAGVFLNSRQFMKLDISFLHDLAQSRKDGTDLVWCAQFDEQVDKQFRLLTQFFVHCSSLSRYSSQLRRPIMFFKNVKWFKASAYFDWMKDPRNQDRPLRSRFIYASKTETGTLTESDKMIFNCFSSFTRLDIVSSFSSQSDFVEPKIITIWKCDLPIDYYRSRIFHYLPQLDPFSSFFDPLQCPHKIDMINNSVPVNMLVYYKQSFSSYKHSKKVSRNGVYS